MAVRLGIALGDHVTVRDNGCTFCAVERKGAVGRSGRVESVLDNTHVRFTAANKCPLDHTMLVRYDEKWSDGGFGKVTCQYFAVSELELIG